jgi:hypothetical protein
VFTFDAAAGEADSRYEGLSVLFTTAPLHHSGDALFTQFKEQDYIKLLHHQMKTPTLGFTHLDIAIASPIVFRLGPDY